MNTFSKHRIYYKNAKQMSEVKNNSVDLIITSPPYPMISMWDDIFSFENKTIKKALKEGNGDIAFELMHKELDSVWNETYRILKPGGIVCINIGDATRTLNNNFKLYNSHSRIINYLINIGFSNLPNIIWHKQTNAPNKFMGSGMLPPGAYVTLEHEYILIFRKGNKRSFTKINEKENRSKSSYFWEERNIWFSDIWNNLKGIKQNLNNDKLRKRSGAYPFELAYRLINMFSVKGDTILDPFLGTGTTTLASIASERNSIGYEIDSNFKDLINNRLKESKTEINNYILNRIKEHEKFICEKIKTKNFRYKNINHDFFVMTNQEKQLKLNLIKDIKFEDDFIVFYQ